MVLNVQPALYYTIVFGCQGYDMEDAMILIKSSYERGFRHGQVYKADVGHTKRHVPRRNNL